MPGPFECNKCHKTYSTIYTLKTHQETSKSCVKPTEDNSVLIVFDCDDCENNFTSKYGLNKHLKICMKRLIRLAVEEYRQKLADKDKQLDIKDDKIKELEIQSDKKYREISDQKDKEINKLEQRVRELTTLLVNKPTNVITNNNNNTSSSSTSNTMNKNNINVVQYLKEVNKPVTDTLLSESVKNLRLHHCLQGAKGLAEYAYEYALTEIALVCTDVSRNKFQYTEEINGSNRHTVDPELIQFNPRFFKTIKDKISDIITPHMNDLMDTGEEYNMEKSQELANVIKNVNNASEGRSNDLTDEFIRCLAPRCATNIALKRLPLMIQ